MIGAYALLLGCLASRIIILAPGPVTTARAALNMFGTNLINRYATLRGYSVTESITAVLLGSFATVDPGQTATQAKIITFKSCILILQIRTARGGILDLTGKWISHITGKSPFLRTLQGGE